MSTLKGKLKEGSMTSQLKDFIEAGNEPTTIEVAELLFNDRSEDGRRGAMSILVSLRHHYRIIDIPFNAIRDPETKEWRHKKLGTAEEVASKVDGERKTCERSFKNICFRDSYIKRHHPKAKLEIAETEMTLLELQQTIISERMLQLTNLNNADKKHQLK